MVKIRNTKTRYLTILLLLLATTIPLSTLTVYAVHMNPEDLPEDVVKALSINYFKKEAYDTDRWDGKIEIEKASISPIKCSEDGCFASINIVLYVVHEGDISGMPTKDGKDWYEPYWNIFFKIAIKDSKDPTRDVFRSIEISRFYKLSDSKNLRMLGRYYWVGTETPENIGCIKGFEATWIKRESNINSVRRLLSIAKTGEKVKYYVEGELSIKCDKFKVITNIEDIDSVTIYAGIIGWTMPGSVAPGGDWLIAYDKKTLNLNIIGGEEQTQPQTTAITTKPYRELGLEKNLELKTLQYDMQVSYELKGVYRGEEKHDWLKALFTYTVSLGNISNNTIFIKAKVSNLEVDTNDPEVKGMIENQIESLEYTGEIPLLGLSSGIKNIIEAYAKHQEQTGLEGVKYEVESSSYNNIPAIKVYIHGEGRADITGAEKANYVLKVLAYYDEYLGIPLYIESYFYINASSGKDYLEGESFAKAVLVKGIESLPRISTKPGVIVDFGEEGIGVVKFTAANAEIASVDYSSTRLELVVSGRGTGSILIELPGNIRVRRVLVDNEPVEYTILASTPSRTVILVSVTLSEHRLSIDFTDQILSAKTKNIKVGEQIETPQTTIEETSEVSEISTQPTTPATTSHIKTEQQVISEKTEIVEEEQKTTDGIPPLKLDTTMMLMIVAVIAIIIAVVAVVIAVARR